MTARPYHAFISVTSGTPCHHCLHNPSMLSMSLAKKFSWGPRLILTERNQNCFGLGSPRHRGHSTKDPSDALAPLPIHPPRVSERSNVNGDARVAHASWVRSSGKHRCRTGKRVIARRLSPFLSGRALFVEDGQPALKRLAESGSLQPQGFLDQVSAAPVPDRGAPWPNFAHQRRYQTVTSADPWRHEQLRMAHRTEH